MLNTGDKLVLIDTGTGSQKLMGPDTGKLLANLKAAGIDPKDIDAVALTHAHPDHCWGLLDEAARGFSRMRKFTCRKTISISGPIRARPRTT